MIAVYTLPYLILLVPVQFSGEVYVFDGLIRGDCGRSPITEYASLWTLFFYVPTWLMALFLASHCALGGPSSRAVTVLTLACLPYLGDMGAVWASASTSFVLDPLSPQLNLLLLNPLNKYHPFLLYSALALSLHLTLSYSRLLTNVGYSLPFGMGEGGTKSLRNLTSGFIVSALYAGSWWALQEGTWGGWWNWDPSEVLGLLILLPLIFCWHQRGRPVSESMNSYRFGLGAWCTGVAYVLIQLNFEAVSHNFGIQLFFFFITIRTITSSWPPFSPL